MTDNSPHKFAIEPAYARSQRTNLILGIVLVVFFLGFAAFVQGLGAVVLLVIAAVFALCIVPALVSTRRLPAFTILADDDGLWEAQKSKAEGLVPWSRVCWMRENWHSQRCDLIDEHGHELIRLHYRLHELPLLRSWIVERAVNFRQHSGSSNVFTRSRKTRIVELCCVVFLIGMMGWFIWEFGTFGGICAVLLIAALANEHRRSVCRLELTPAELILGYAWKQRSVSRSQIADIRITNLEESNHLHVVVHLYLIGERKHISLAALQIEPLELYQRLTDWRSQGTGEARAESVESAN